MKFVNKIVDLIKNNFKIKISICIFLLLVLIMVIILGSVYSNNLNNKNLTFKVTRVKDSKESSAINKEEDLEIEKKNKLNEIKKKIKELDESVNFNVVKENVDNEIKYYEELYLELLRKNEEAEKENTYNENEADEPNNYDEPVYVEPNYDIENNQGGNSPAPNNSSSVVSPPVITPPNNSVPSNDENTQIPDNASDSESDVENGGEPIEEIPPNNPTEPEDGVDQENPGENNGVDSIIDDNTTIVP